MEKIIKFSGKMYIVKKEQKDNKGRFSKEKLQIKPNINISYPEIKKASDISASNTGNHQAKHDYFIGRSRYESSKSDKRLNHNGNQAHHRNNGQMTLKHSDILPPLKEVGASCSMTLMSQA